MTGGAMLHDLAASRQAFLVEEIGLVRPALVRGAGGSLVGDRSGRVMAGRVAAVAMKVVAQSLVDPSPFLPGVLGNLWWSLKFAATWTSAEIASFAATTKTRSSATLSSHSSFGTPPRRKGGTSLLDDVEKYNLRIDAVGDEGIPYEGVSHAGLLQKLADALRRI